MGYITRGMSSSQSREDSNGLHKSCCLGIPKMWRNQMGYVNPCASGSPSKEESNGLHKS